jgi:hypothetical protein
MPLRYALDFGVAGACIWSDTVLYQGTYMSHLSETSWFDDTRWLIKRANTRVLHCFHNDNDRYKRIVAESDHSRQILVTLTIDYQKGSQSYCATCIDY